MYLFFKFHLFKTSDIVDCATSGEYRAKNKYENFVHVGPSH